MSRALTIRRTRRRRGPDGWRSIGPMPLLTAEEERELARLVRDGLAADPGDPADAGRIAAGRAAEDRFVRSNVGLILSEAAHYARKLRIEYDDAVSLVAMGVIEAIRRFDPDAGFRFTTYAKHWIRHHAMRGGVEILHRIHIPAYLFKLVCRSRRGVAPPRREQAEYVARAEVAMSFVPTGAREESPLDLVASSGDVGSELSRAEDARLARLTVTAAMGLLEPVERELVEVWCKVHPDGLTYASVAEKHGRTREWGRLRANAAVLRLRGMLEVHYRKITAS